ncbi:hypothetical protein DSECCO2_531660 [anaerobic digester metagenome]
MWGGAIEDIVILKLGTQLHIEADGFLICTFLDDLFQTKEGSTSDEEDILGVHFDEILLRMLASAFGGDIHFGAFQSLEQGLLYTFAGNVTGDGWCLAFAGDLVDFIDVHDTPFCFGHIIIGVLKQANEDVFHVFTHVTSLGQCGGVADREGYLQKASKSLGDQGLTASGGTDHHDVALFQIHFVIVLLLKDSLIMVVNRYGDDFLGTILADHVLIQVALYLAGRGCIKGFHIRFRCICLHNVVTHFDAVVTDIAGDATDQVCNFGFVPATE